MRSPPPKSTAIGTTATNEHGQFHGPEPDPGVGCRCVDLRPRRCVVAGDAGPSARHLQCVSAWIGIRADTSCQEDVHRQSGAGHGDGWKRRAHARVPGGRAGAFSEPARMHGSGRRVVPPAVRSGSGRKHRPGEHRCVSAKQPPGWRGKGTCIGFSRRDPTGAAGSK